MDQKFLWSIWLMMFLFGNRFISLSSFFFHFAVVEISPLLNHVFLEFIARKKKKQSIQKFKTI